ncbi:protein ZBED8-like [Ctenocephalides felis]|uniref:protein ZBED8-like n=1 Tax=Ctenocephalides felis TaxID=7515 RepID=UPI000E6E3269|nr:protein ZBED8-like [Ctenocephalides felis]XP_026475533.1 protein ZBED8-like [Ctenocephalides felis]
MCLGLRENNLLKVDFQNDKLCTFWRKAAAEYTIIADRALKILIAFATTYRCETGFSAFLILKTKVRNRMNIEHDMRCSLSEAEPNIVKLATLNSTQNNFNLRTSIRVLTYNFILLAWLVISEQM